MRHAAMQSTVRLLASTSRFETSLACPESAPSSVMKLQWQKSLFVEVFLGVTTFVEESQDVTCLPRVGPFQCDEAAVAETCLH